MKKNLLPIVLALLMLTSACSASKPTPNAENENLAVNVAWSSEGGAYKQVDEFGMNDAACILTRGNEVYTLATVLGEGGTIKSELRCGAELIYSPLNAFFNCAALDADSVWVLECGFDGKNGTSRLKQISSVGDVKKEIFLEDYLDFCKSAYTMLCSDGKIYLGNGKEIQTWHDDGKIGEAYKLQDVDRLDLITGSDGRAYAVCYYPDSTEIKLISGEKIESVLTIKTADARIFRGTDAGDFVLADDRGLFHLDFDGSTSPILIWEDCGIRLTELKKVVALPDGEYLCLDVGGVSKLTPIDPSELEEQTELVLATVGEAGTVKISVAGFNRTNSKYKIVIKDYSEGGANDTQTAIKRLNTDLISGKYPDMFLFSELTPFAYINKGYLLDLYSFIDSDTEIKREDIAILKQLEVDSGVFYMSNTFLIETLVALHSEFGDVTSWTLDKYLELEKNAPSEKETLNNNTKSRFIHQISSRYINLAVDWKKGLCDFDNDVFVSILEASDRIKENPENPKALDFTYPSKKVANKTRVASLSWVENVGKLAMEEKMAGCRLSFIGWPTVDGSCGSDIILSSPVGICSQSNNTEAAWEFLKFMLKDFDIESPGSLPVYMPYLQQQIEMAKREAPPGGTQITQEDADRLLDLLSSIENVAIYDETILNIIDEEASAFFAGQKTAEETAKIIQQRVGLYIAEQS